MRSIPKSARCCLLVIAVVLCGRTLLFMTRAAHQRALLARYYVEYSDSVPDWAQGVPVVERLLSRRVPDWIDIKSDRVDSTVWARLGEIATVKTVGMIDAWEDAPVEHITLNPTCIWFGMHNCRLSDTTLVVLFSRHRFFAVHLSNMTISREVLATILQNDSLEDLRLDGCDLTGIDFSGLRPPPRLSSLKVGHAKVGDEVATLVSSCLEWFEGYGTQISDELVRQLAESCPGTLKRVNLSETKITGEAWKDLSRLRQLESLDVRNTSVSNDGLQMLRANQKLFHLNLQGTAANAEGIRDLQRHLPKCQIEAHP